MTTENGLNAATDEAKLDESSPQPSADQPSQPTDPAESLRAEVAQLKAANAQLTQEVRSALGRVVAQKDLQRIMKQLTDEQATNSLAIKNLLTALKSGNAQQQTAALNRVEADLGQSQQRRQAATVYDSLVQDLREAIQDEKGEYILDLDEAPELEDIRTQWEEGLKNRADAEYYRKLIRKATQVANRTALNRAVETATKVQKRSKQDELDMSTGPEAGGGGSAKLTRERLSTSASPSKGAKKLAEEWERDLDAFYGKK